MITSIFTKYPYFAILGFFLYITCMTRFFNTITSINRSVYTFYFPFQIMVSLVCLLLLLPSLFRTTHIQKIKKPVENKIRFIASRFCSGFFFAYGSWYFFNSFRPSQDLLKINIADVVWSQISLLSILALSILFFTSFYMPKKDHLYTFTGIVLFLLGFFSLFHTRELINQLDVLTSVLYPAKISPDFFQHVIMLVLFAIFWLLAVKINRYDARYFENNAAVWANTLLFNCLISFLIVLYTNQVPVLLKALKHGTGLPGFITYVIFGAFLWFCIRIFGVLDTGIIIEKNVIHDQWLLSILTMVFLAPLLDVYNAAFLLKVLLTAAGIYFFWKPDQSNLSGARVDEIKQIVFLLLLSIMFSAVFVLIACRLSFYSLYLSSMIRDFLHMVLGENLFENPLSRFVLAMLHQINTAFKFMRGNVLAAGCLVTGFIMAYLYKRYSFKKSVIFLLNGLFAGFISFLAAGLILNYYLIFFRAPENHILWLHNIHMAYKEWEIPIINTIYLMLFVFSFKKAVRKGSRLILWTVLSNYILYISICISVTQLLLMAVSMYSETVFANIASSYYLINIAVQVVPLIILLLSVLIYSNNSIEERILPALLRCRLPSASEKEKIEEVVSILLERELLPNAMAIQVYISQRKETNAYTIGNKSIAITYSLFRTLTSQQIAGVLSHELGHIKHNDGRLRVLLYILNLPTVLIIKVFNCFSFQYFPIFTTVGFLCLFVLSYTHTLELMGFGLGGIVFWFLLQTAIFLMENQDMQDSEWMADEFASSKGLGQELKEALIQMAAVDEQEDVRESWMEKYPDLAERIKRLETLQNPIGA